MPLIQRHTIQGEPLRVGEREIIPEAQVTTWINHSATIGAQSISGRGGGVVSIRPTAVIERVSGMTRRVPIRDETSRLLLGLVAGAIFVLFLAQVAERLAAPKGNTV
jgi:hypothetical protein